MIKNSFKTVCVLIYALVFGEFFFRIMAPQPLIPRYVTGGQDGIRANIPNVTYHQKTPEIWVELRINSQGIRSDKEFTLDKPDDTFRIILLGDSFFMGYEVELENSMSWLLEDKLNDKGLKTEVINLAVSGFGTAENLITLKNRGTKFNPNLVIMEWHSTDPADNIRSNLFQLNDTGLREKNKNYLPGIAARDALMKIPGYQWLTGSSHLYCIFRNKAAVFVKDVLLKRRKKENEDKIVKNAEKRKKNNFLDEALIAEIRYEAGKSGAELILLDVPKRKSRIKYESAFSLLDLSKLRDETLVSPMDAFGQVASPQKKLYYEKGYGHWTIEGNMIVSNVLVDHILASKSVQMSNILQE